MGFEDRKIEAAGGFLPFHDKSDPQAIQAEFGMSKKTFKKAIGTLYRKELVVIEEGGVRRK